MIKVLLLVMFSILLLMSCNENSVIPGENEIYHDNIINPGEVGSYWKYINYYDPVHWSNDTNWVYRGFDSFNLNFVNNEWKRIDSTKREITEEVFISFENTNYISRAFTNIKLPKANNNSGTRWLYWNGTDGIYSMGGFSSTDTFVTKSINIKYPVEKDNSWQESVVYYNGVNFDTRKSVYTKCVSTNEIISTPFGQYECIVYVKRDYVAEDVSGFYDYYLYYAPNIGLVCSVMQVIPPDEKAIDGVYSVKLLYDYKIKK